jgi:hypothetical protein
VDVDPAVDVDPTPTSQLSLTCVYPDYVNKNGIMVVWSEGGIRGTKRRTEAELLREDWESLRWFKKKSFNGESEFYGRYQRCDGRKAGSRRIAGKN